MKDYVLYIPLSGDPKPLPVDWKALLRDYRITIVRSSNNSALVFAYPRDIERLKQSHPEIQVAEEQKFFKLLQGEGEAG